MVNATLLSKKEMKILILVASFRNRIRANPIQTESGIMPFSLPSLLSHINYVLDFPGGIADPHFQLGSTVFASGFLLIPFCADAPDCDNYWLGVKTEVVEVSSCMASQAYIVSDGLVLFLVMRLFAPSHY